MLLDCTMRLRSVIHALFFYSPASPEDPPYSALDWSKIQKQRFHRFWKRYNYSGADVEQHCGDSLCPAHDWYLLLFLVLSCSVYDWHLCTALFLCWRYADINHKSVGVHIIPAFLIPPPNHSVNIYWLYYIYVFIYYILALEAMEKAVLRYYEFMKFLHQICLQIVVFSTHRGT